MAGNNRNANSNKHHKPTAAELQQKQDQEEEEQQQVETEQEVERDTQQDKMGNQGVAAMLGMPTVSPGSAGLSVEGQERSKDSDVDYGGDDEPVEDGVLTIDDITRSWNQGTKRGKDRAVFVEEMPGEDLPPADMVFLDAVRADLDIPILPEATGMDSLIQPSQQVVGGDLAPWTNEVIRWSDGSLIHRAWHRMLRPPAPLLQDPHGRVVISRTRVCTLATLLLLDSPIGRGEPGPKTSAFLTFSLELAGRHSTVRQLWSRVQATGEKLPRATGVFKEALTFRPAAVVPEPLGDQPTAHLRAVMSDLLDLVPSGSLVGSLHQEVEEEEDDDPLGLDAVLAEFTGGDLDLQGPIYQAYIDTAEKIASHCARVRVGLAGVALAICEVGRQWSSGAPTTNLVASMAKADDLVGKVLHLLVEVARAAQGRTVGPKGVRNGLRRAARMLDGAVMTSCIELTTVIGGVLPGPPDGVPAGRAADSDELTSAWLDGQPADAMPWLERLPPTLENRGALAFTMMAVGAPAEQTLSVLRAVREDATERPFLRLAAEVCMGACLLRTGGEEEALALAHDHLELARSRRNGIVAASATILGIEAQLSLGASPNALRHRGGVLAWHVGSRSAISLISRWAPPSDSDRF